MGTPQVTITIDDLLETCTNSTVRIIPDQGILSSSFNTLKELISANTVVESGDIPKFKANPSISQTFLTNILKLYFALTSVFTLASSATLKDSQTSLPNGIIGGIVYTALVCNSFYTLIA